MKSLHPRLSLVLRDARALRARVRRARGAEQSLDAIGRKTGTPKSSDTHGYLDTYESSLRHLRRSKLQLIEIGVGEGASLHMWAEYFQRASVVGVDIDESCVALQSERISMLIGDQSDQEFLIKLAKRSHPKVVIDDGSHVWSHQIQTFRTLFPVVRPGGIYIIEGIHTSFGEDHAKKYGSPTDLSAFEYLKAITAGLVAGTRATLPLDEFESYCRQTIESCTFARHFVIVKKARFSQRKYRLGSVAKEALNPVLTHLGNAYERVPALLVGTSDHVSQQWRNLMDAGPVTFAPAASGELRNVTVVGRGLGLTRAGTILDETLNVARGVRRATPMYRPCDGSIWVNEKPLVPAGKFDAPRRKKYVLLKQFSDANYGHWLIDTLPKIGLLDGLAELAQCILVLNAQADASMRRIVMESLHLVGVRPDQTLFLTSETYEFEKLTVLGTITRHPVAKSPFAIAFLSRLARQVPSAGADRIYLSRNSYTRRRIVNEEPILKHLHRHGYITVKAEQLSLREQIALFKSASFVVGNMGAAMSNLAFSPPGVSVLALATERMAHDYFYDIVCHKEGRYRGLQGSALAEPRNLSSDFQVDVDLFRESLDWLHS